MTDLNPLNSTQMPFKITDKHNRIIIKHQRDVIHPGHSTGLIRFYMENDLGLKSNEAFLFVNIVEDNAIPVVKGAFIKREEDGGFIPLLASSLSFDNEGDQLIYYITSFPKHATLYQAVKISNKYVPGSSLSPLTLSLSTAQWVAKAVANSCWSDFQCSAAILGPPDVYPLARDGPNQWGPAVDSYQDAWLEIEFANKTFGRTLTIYYTWGPGKYMYIYTYIYIYVFISVCIYIIAHGPQYHLSYLYAKY
jgi:hypothetical protein